MSYCWLPINYKLRKASDFLNMFWDKKIVFWEKTILKNVSKMKILKIVGKWLEEYRDLRNLETFCRTMQHTYFECKSGYFQQLVKGNTLRLRA